MNTIYNAKVNNLFDFKIDEESLTSLDAYEVSESKFHILNNNKSYLAEINASNFNQKLYEVKVNENTYKVSIINDLDDLIKKMGFEIGSIKKVNQIKAPMPGLILDVNIKIGQEVIEDEALLILEAMKMENVITSPRDGIIKSISANKGDAVDKNQLLIEFE